MLTMCPTATLAALHAHHTAADAVPGSALRDPARDAKPGGTPRCKNAGTCVHGESRSIRSNPVVRSADSKNLRSVLLGAGPRPALPCQLTWCAVHATAADSAALARDAAPSLGRSRDSADSLDAAAS